MKNKLYSLICVILAITVIAAFALPAFAADALSISFEGDVLTVSGTDINAAFAPVTASICNTELSICIPKQTVADETGFYSFKFSLENLEVGQSYTVRLGGGVSASREFYYPTDDEATASLYVSPDGSADAAGTHDDPFNTIAAAQKAVRSLINSENRLKSINVYIKSGEYVLSQPLSFDENDSSEHITVSYIGIGKTLPVISAAAPVTDWTYYGNGIYYAHSDDEINNLFENGETAIKARYPNAGEDGIARFLRAQALPNGASKTGFCYSDGDFPNIGDITDLEAYLWSDSGQGWMWFSNIEDVSSIENNTITLAHQTRYTIGTGSPYYLQGALEFLDEPGEYYYSSSQKRVYYMPRGDISACSVSAAKLSNCINICGNSAPVRNLTFENLDICGTERTEAFDETNGSFTKTGSAIVLENTENITLRSCRIHDCGGDGVVLNNYNSKNVIYGNKIYNVGRNGVQTAGSDETKPTNETLISNNEITDGSLYIGHGHGVLLGNLYGTDNKVTHNRIRDFKRIGICVNTNYGGTNYVEYNDISHVNTESEDSGMIYAMMQHNGAGVVVRNNYLHDSTVFAGGGFGIYFDNLSHNCVAENNIITRLGANGSAYTAAAISAKGDDTVIRNNYIINNELTIGAIMSNAQGGSNPTAERLTVEKNIIANNKSRLYYFVNWTADRVKTADNNLFYESDYTIFKPPVASLTLSGWQALGYDKNSLCADPLIGSDFVLATNSPALSLGIKQIDKSGIGLCSDYKFTDETPDSGESGYVTSAVLLDSENRVVSSLSESSSLNIGIKASSDKEETVTVAVAQYISDELCGLSLFRNVSLGQQPQVLSAKLNAAPDSEFYKVKIMVMDSENTLKPLDSSVTISQ